MFSLESLQWWFYRLHYTPVLFLISLGQLCCSGVFDGHMFWKQKERLLDGSFLSVTRNDGDVIVDRNAVVTKCDSMATNGLVHVINHVSRQECRSN